MKPVLDETHFSRAGSSSDTLAFNYTALGAEHRAVDLALRNDAFVYGQEEYRELLAVEGDQGPLREYSRFRNYLSRSSTDERTFTDWLASRFRQFYSLEDWLSDMSRHRFCFGTRFHGNMVALQAGVPALWVVHDRRTEELCNHLALPWIHLSEIGDRTTIRELEDRTDYSAFFRKYPANYAKLHDYLSAAGISHRLPAPILN